jgi:asparagine synthase (glutamine-hydrolysing)
VVQPAPLRPLELASGIVTGGAPVVLPDTPSVPGTSISDLLRAAVAPSLRAGRCFVSFSGGVDSSIVLSAATQVARREGLADPIPLTWRFTGAPAAEESRWQERVIAELGLADWVRLTAAPGELDLVGPLAERVLRSHGVLHPANAFLHLPLLEHARGATLLTGVGGDQVFGGWRWREAAAVLRGERRLSARSALTVARSRLPVALRVGLERQDDSGGSPWLWPRAERAVRYAVARDSAAEPPDWRARVAWQAGRRDLALGRRSLELLALDVGAAIAHPLLDPGFLAGLAAAGGRHGLGNRATTIAALLADLMPGALAGRSDKADFQDVFWEEPSRALMARWDGEGVDTGIVDAAALRAIWRGPEPAARTAHLLQSVWLAAHAADAL